MTGTFLIIFAITAISAAPLYVVTMFLKYKLEERRTGSATALGLAGLLMAIPTAPHAPGYAAALLIFGLLATNSPLPKTDWRLHICALVAGGLIGASVNLAVYSSAGRLGALDIVGLAIVLPAAGLFLAAGPRLYRPTPDQARDS